MLNMKIKQINITALSHDGRGIAHIDGKTTFITNALPGETVEFFYLRKHSNYDEGVANKILTRSPERIDPKCPYFDVCGGCNLQHLTHEKQLELKLQTLKEQLSHFGANTPKTFSAPISGAIWHYRGRARLSVKYVNKKQKLLIGFHEKNGRFVADIESCAILAHPLSEKIPELRSFISELSIYDQIPQIEIAITNNVIALTFRVLKTPNENDLEKFKQFGNNHNFLIYLQPGSNDSSYCVNSSQEYLSYELPSYNLELLFKPHDFTQINQEINQKLIARALELLDPQSDDNILDLFCGLGNFTLPLAQKCHSIVGIEGSVQMTARAEINAKHNQISNAKFYAADLTKELSAMWATQKYSKILLDPPRTGALEICRDIAKFGAKKIVYISCSPATLARDAKEIIAEGYKLKNTGTIDMFPHTGHTEAIAEFSK